MSASKRSESETTLGVLMGSLMAELVFQPSTLLSGLSSIEIPEQESTVLLQELTYPSPKSTRGKDTSGKN